MSTKTNFETIVEKHEMKIFKIVAQAKHEHQEKKSS